MANEQGAVLAKLQAPLVYRMSGMDAVTVRRGIAYRAAAAGEPRMDVYTPPGQQESERRPAVVFVHGGPISPDLPLAPIDWGVYRGYGALAAASGWVGVTFNSRYYGFDHLDEAADNIRAAVAYIRAHADELGVDGERLCLWAFSGGGVFLADWLRERPVYVRCLVAYYTMMDLRPLASVESLAGVVAAETLRRFSPVAALEDAGGDPIAVPLLMARAGQDNPGLNALFDAFAQAALAANMSLDLLNHPSGYHAFDTLNDDARTHEILQRTLAFVRERLEQ